MATTFEPTRSTPRVNTAQGDAPSVLKRITSVIVGLNLALLVLVAISGDLAERSWVTMMISYLPVFPFLVPTLVIILLCILTRQVWMAGFHIAGFVAAVLVLVPFGLPRVQMPFLSAKADVKTVRVMTFNVQLGRGGAEKARRLIQDQKPDVFCLQEARGEAIEAQIREGLPGYEIRWDGAMVIGSRLPITEYRTHALPYAGELRQIQDVTVDWEGYPVRVLNLHFNPCYVDRYLLEDPSKLEGHLNALSVEQSEQTEKILSLVPGTPPIVCGDFNMPPRGGNYRKLRKVMHDAFVEAGEGLGLTIPAQFPMERLDQIFLAYGWKTQRSWIPREVASDHLPLLAEVYPFTPSE